MNPKSVALARERGMWVDALARVGSVLRREGLAGSIRLAATRAGQLAYLREAHVWYCLSLLEHGTLAVKLPLGLKLANVREVDLEILEQLPTVGVNEAQRRLDAGVDLWVVLNGHRVAFSCWIYRDHMPAATARQWVRLPPTTVGLEDSATSTAFRVHVLAPAAWSSIACRLGHEGVGAILTTIAETNLPCRRAAELVGFKAVASMDLQRIGGRSRVDLRSYNTDGIGPFLAEQLAR